MNDSIGKIAQLVAHFSLEGVRQYAGRIGVSVFVVAEPGIERRTNRWDFGEYGDIEEPAPR